LRVWVEIDRRAARANVRAWKTHVAPAKLFAVVKSNAYGHGLVLASKLFLAAGADALCVDSAVEAFRLRKEGIIAPILVLGHTLPSLFDEARREQVTISVSSQEALRTLARMKHPPFFHIKIDTGMHRQGVFPKEIDGVIRLIAKTKQLRSAFAGAYTHFSSAKDIFYPSYTEQQFRVFRDAVARLKKALRLPDTFIAHASATGGVLMDPRYHLDAVRVGIGLYGLWPSHELERECADRITLHPVLSWRSVISEVKRVPKGMHVGYDGTERLHRPSLLAVVPVGYWHGIPRSVSSRGHVLVRGKRARIVGRVSMDMIVIDVTGIALKPGDLVTLIGRDGAEEITASAFAEWAGTSHYEIVTRINPLSARIGV
jgi:alanine racemase